MDKDRAQEPHQDVQDKERDESSYLIGGWNMFNVSLGTKILILNSIGGQIILDFHWFLKDEKAMDWMEGFPQLPLDKKNKLKEG
jgi:hypothetical protein